MTTETAIPNTITKETAQKIDYLIQGVEDGKFDDVAKKIEFVKKLNGDFEAPAYMQELLHRIDVLEEEKHELKERVRELQAQNSNIEMEYENDMRDIAKAIQWLMKPDPLANELYDIDQFIIKKGQRKY